MHAVIRLAVACAVATATSAFSTHALAAPRFELAPQVGYAGTFTTGLSPYRTFVALGARARPVAALWLGTSLFAFVGSRAAGDGPNLAYRAHDRAYALAFDATWRFDAGRLELEPGAEVGAAWILGSTYVTPREVTDRYVAANVGPVFRLAWRAGSLGLGAEVAGLFVPSYVAAPIVRAGVLVVVPF